MGFKKENGRISVEASAEIKGRVYDAIIDSMKNKKEVRIKEMYHSFGDTFRVWVDNYTDPTGNLYYDFNIESMCNLWMNTISISSANWNICELFSGEMLDDIVDMFFNNMVVRFEMREEERKEI